MDRREKNQKTEIEKYFGRTETKTIKSGKQEMKRKTVGRTYRKTKTEKGKRKKHLPKKIRNRPKTGNFFDLYKKYFGIIKNGLEETLRYRYRYRSCGLHIDSVLFLSRTKL